MKNSFLVIVVMIIVAFSLLDCNDSAKRSNTTELSKTKEEVEREEVLKTGEEIAFKEYGDVIKNELPLKAKLEGDSVWIIEGTLAKDMDGGTVYIKLRRGDKKVLKLIHYK